MASGHRIDECSVVRARYLSRHEKRSTSKARRSVSQSKTNKAHTFSDFVGYQHKGLPDTFGLENIARCTTEPIINLYHNMVPTARG